MIVKSRQFNIKMFSKILIICVYYGCYNYGVLIIYKPDDIIRLFVQRTDIDSLMSLDIIDYQLCQYFRFQGRHNILKSELYNSLLHLQLVWYAQAMSGRCIEVTVIFGVSNRTAVNISVYKYCTNFLTHPSTKYEIGVVVSPLRFVQNILVYILIKTNAF